MLSPPRLCCPSARGTGAAGLGIFNSAGGDRPHSRRTDDNTPNLGQPNEFVAGSGSRAVALLKPGAPSRSRHTDDLSPEPADLAAQLEAEKIKNKLLADALDAERKKSRTLEDQVRALQARLQTDPGPSPINISISPTRQIPETVQAPAPAGDDFGPDTMKKLDALSIKTEEVAKDETPEGKRKGHLPQAAADGLQRRGGACAGAAGARAEPVNQTDTSAGRVCPTGNS